MISGALPSGVCVGGMGVAVDRDADVGTTAVGDGTELQDTTPIIKSIDVRRNIIHLHSVFIFLLPCGIISHR